jgi:hypothetical protein
MIPVEVYKNIHLLGVFMVLVALGGAMLYGMVSEGKELGWRKVVSITHGLGLLLVIVAGFGMLARLGISWPWPGWVWGKVAIWVLLGALIAPARRSAGAAKGLWWIVILLAAVAAYLAIHKPM